MKIDIAEIRSIQKKLGFLCSYISADIVKNSDFTDYDKAHTYLNDESVKFKNNTFTLFSRGLNGIKFNQKSLNSFIINKAHAKLYCDIDFDIINDEKLKMNFRDYYYFLMTYSSDNQDNKRLKLVLTIFFISYSMQLKSGNIYLLIPGSIHSTFYIDLFHHLIVKYYLKFTKGEIVDFGYHFYTYLGSYIHGDILAWKYQKHNYYGFTNIDIFKIFHSNYGVYESYFDYKHNFHKKLEKLKIIDKTSYDDKFYTRMFELNSEPYRELFLDVFDTSSDDVNYDFNSFEEIEDKLGNILDHEYLQKIEDITKTFGIQDKHFWYFFLVFHNSNLNIDGRLSTYMNQFSEYYELFANIPVTKNMILIYARAIYNLNTYLQDTSITKEEKIQIYNMIKNKN